MGLTERSSVHLDVLDRVEIASPCTMSWEQLTPMEGGQGADGKIGVGGMHPRSADAVRHCAQCNLNVYNVANMTREETLTLIEQWEPGTRLCAALHRRSDGTIITRDCPVGVRAARQRLVRIASRAAAAVMLLLTGGILFARAQNAEQANPWGNVNEDRTTVKARLRDTQPFARVCDLVRPRKPVSPPVMRTFTMGILIRRPPQPTSVTGPTSDTGPTSVTVPTNFIGPTVAGK